jgi:hypothetical protein
VPISCIKKTFNHCDTIPDRNSLREEEFILLIVSEALVQCGGDGVAEQNSSHIGGQEVERENICTPDFYFFSLYSFQGLGQWGGASHNQGRSCLLSESSLETPSQSHPEGSFTNFIGASKSN